MNVMALIQQGGVILYKMARKNWKDMTIYERYLYILKVAAIVLLICILVASFVRAETSVSNATTEITISLVKAGNDLIIDYNSSNGIHYNLSDNFSVGYKFNYTYFYTSSITINNLTDTNNMTIQQIINYNNDSMAAEIMDKTITRINNLEDNCVKELIVSCKKDIESCNSLSLGLNGSLAICNANVTYLNGMVNMRDDQLKTSKDDNTQQFMVICALGLMITLIVLFASQKINIGNPNKGMMR